MSVILNNVDRIVNSSGDAIDFAQGVGGGSSKEFVATGNISQGQTVGLKADGTVEGVGIVSTPQTGSMTPPFAVPKGKMYQTSVVYHPETQQYIVAAILSNWDSYVFTAKIDGNTFTYGGSVVFRSPSFNTGHFALIPNTNKFALFFSLDGGNGGVTNGYGSAVVGEITGTSITLGTMVTYSSNNESSANFCTYDQTSGKIVVTHGTRVYVATVNGNGITFGTPVNLASGKARSVLSIPNTNKFIVASTGGYTYVGEVSGDSVTLSSPIACGISIQTSIMKYDQATNQILMYARTSTSAELSLGTFDGTTISWGTPVSLGNVTYKTIDKDDASNQFVFTGNGSIRRGTISGNSITLESEESYMTGSPMYENGIMDTDQNKLGIFFSDWSSAGGQKGYGVVATLNGNILSTNASSWLGIADNAITSGGSGKVNLNGSIDSHQTGLTAGNTYYVNYDGTLTDTPNEGAKNGTYGKIGKALSATSLLLSK